MTLFNSFLKLVQENLCMFINEREIILLILIQSLLDITVYGDVFFTRYRELVEGFKDSKRVVCIPFWPVKEKINIITDVAFSTGSRICDLSHLRSGIDPENFASSYKNTDSRESVLILAIQEWTESQKYSVRSF